MPDGIRKYQRHPMIKRNPHWFICIIIYCCRGWCGRWKAVLVCGAARVEAGSGDTGTLPCLGNRIQFPESYKAGSFNTLLFNCRPLLTQQNSQVFFFQKERNSVSQNWFFSPDSWKLSWWKWSVEQS